MAKLVIFGAGDIARLAHHYFTHDSPHEVAAFVVDRAFRQADEFQGLPLIDAERLARQLIADPRVALDALVREELGLDPGELGSPIGAAVSSFLAFAVGALIPVVPFFFGDSLALVATSLVLSGVALFGVGAVLSLFTGKGAMFSQTRWRF